MTCLHYSDYCRYYLGRPPADKLIEAYTYIGLTHIYIYIYIIYTHMYMYVYMHIGPRSSAAPPSMENGYSSLGRVEGGKSGDRPPPTRPTTFYFSCLFAINRSSSGQNKESELLIATTVLQAAHHADHLLIWLLVLLSLLLSLLFVSLVYIYIYITILLLLLLLIIITLYIYIYTHTCMYTINTANNTSNNQSADDSNTNRRNDYTYRFVRVVLAQGPCWSSLYRSNSNGWSPKGIQY